jgi:hypothetical protein
MSTIHNTPTSTSTDPLAATGFEITLHGPSNSWYGWEWSRCVYHTETAPIVGPMTEPEARAWLARARAWLAEVAG